MIVISMVLVIVAAVTLVIGVFFSAGSNDLSLIYVSIGSCLLAGLFLILGVLRQRPRRKPVVESGPAAGPAPWQAGETQPLQAQPAQAQPAQDWYEQRRVSGPAASVLEREEPATATTTPVAPRSQPPEPAPAEAAEGDVDVVVPKPSGQPPEDAEAAPAAGPAPARRGRKATAKKATRKRAGKRAKKAAAPAEAAPAAEVPLAGESAAAGQPEVEEAAVSAEPIAEPSPRKAARPPAAKVAAAPPDEAAAFTQAMSGVSGLGPAKIGDLAQRFGTLERLRAATTAELVAVPGISETLARRIRTALAREEPAPVAEPAGARPTGRKTARAPAAKKAAARQAPTKRVSARKAAAKKAAAGASSRAEFVAALSDVSGLGPARIGDLAQRFGTLERLRAASTAELVAVPGISEMLARRIQRNLR